MSIIQKENKILSVLLLFFSLFIIIFFIKDLFYKVQENRAIKSENEAILSKKVAELEKINSIKNKLDNIWKINKKSGKLTSEQKDSLEMLKFSQNFKEDEMLLYIKDYANNFNKQADEEMISIKSLTFSKPVKSELGFLETKINISAKVANEETMKTFLNFLIWDNSKYKFFITEFSFPNSGNHWALNINIPLRLLHK